MTLRIDFLDIFRATLDLASGNEGYIGISPDGRSYHVVVPVDRQMARNLKSETHPLAPSPFGGYKDWHYFCCQGYRPSATFDEAEIKASRINQTNTNSRLFKEWAAGLGITIDITRPLKT